LNRRLVVPALLALVSALLAGCSGDAEAGGGETRFVSGDGALTIVPESKRGLPVAMEGTTLQGEPLNVTSLQGKPVVINVWGSWCPPCREEAPALQKAYETLKADGVAFVGLDTGDSSVEPALAFERTFGITYPSLFDDEGRLLLALRGAVPPKAIPTTLVLDPQGRIAARVNGALPSTQTLVDLVHDAARTS
jgi:thiol-disulfide isomerase/thioredoxin